MRRLSKMFMLFAPTLFLLVSAPTSAGQRRSSVDEVWAREESYWRFVQAGDVEGYRSLWHPKFRGWPCTAEHPATKASIGDWVREIRDGKVKFTYSLTREGAADLGSVIVVYYHTPMVWQYPDGRTEGSGEEHKFTHTWMRVGRTWQIIGGMCGDLKRSS